MWGGGGSARVCSGVGGLSTVVADWSVGWRSFLDTSEPLVLSFLISFPGFPVLFFPVSMNCCLFYHFLEFSLFLTLLTDILT